MCGAWQQLQVIKVEQSRLNSSVSYLSLSLERSGDVGDSEVGAPSFALFHKAKGAAKCTTEDSSTQIISQDFLDVINGPCV
jgi:hypothetical protein